MAHNFSDISSVSGCTRHPTLHQLPGVCPSCLRERLHQLVATPEDTAEAYPSRRLYLKSPSHSSSSYDYDSLPGRNRSNGSAAVEGGSVLLAIRVNGSLRKSQSIAMASGRLKEQVKKEEEEEAVKMVRRGFWSKLIRFRSGKGRERQSLSHHLHRRDQSASSLGYTFMC